jgi:hypothetical protein
VRGCEVVVWPKKESIMPTLEERVQRLEDIEDIRRLKIRYAELCDAHYDDPDGLAAHELCLAFGGEASLSDERGR